MVNCMSVEKKHHVFYRSFSYGLPEESEAAEQLTGNPQPSVQGLSSVAMTLMTTNILWPQRGDCVFVYVMVEIAHHTWLVSKIAGQKKIQLQLQFSVSISTCTFVCLFVCTYFMHVHDGLCRWLACVALSSPPSWISVYPPVKWSNSLGVCPCENYYIFFIPGLQREIQVYEFSAWPTITHQDSFSKLWGQN